MSKKINISQPLPKINWKDMEMEEELTIIIPHANLLNKIIDPRSSPQEFFVPIRFSAQQHMKDADGFFIPLPKEDPKKKVQQQHQYQNERYQIKLEDLISIDDLGQGSSGRVIKALHRPTNMLVALKTIQIVNDEKFTKQVNLELETLVSCDHQNIIRCYGAFLEGASVAIALEFMNLGTLQDVIKKQGKIPEGMLGLIAYQLLKGLDYLHRTKKIIHRDIKPSNLLINSQGEVKISDFGVSGQLLNTQDQRSTWVGTVTYMSPERFLCEPYSSNTDVWSLGLSLLECAWGVFPYPHPGSNELTHQLGFWEIKEYIVSRPAPPSPSDFSQVGADFIAMCLQKDPGQRKSAAELLEHPFIKQYEDVSLQYLEGWLNINQ
ncbi:unnamed protein product [Paramecium sonneborni]|uniref:Protein kinase domain-containing protein n=1 Tax=Paramecium sonneborni TaxID=65129 RepID=A0A8S1RHC0_9CILI|nr:unnamed protein product [Paramecium sonneborni]